MAPVGTRKAYGVPPETPDTLFESRMFPVSFSHLPHFSQLDVDYSQRGAFGGLLPGLVAGPSRRARAVARGPVSEDEEVRPPKRTRPREPDNDDGEARPPKRVRARAPDDDDEEVRPPKRVRARAPDDDDEEVRQPKRAGAGAAIPEDCQVCLRCSKRLHLEVSSISCGRTIVTGFLCDLGPFHKCSYCAYTKHDLGSQ
jgi:hypothetical protein